MDSVHDDQYMVYIRYDADRAGPQSHGLEQPLASCASYEEARRIRQALQGSAPGECVIRFVGASGGGD